MSLKPAKIPSFFLDTALTEHSAKLSDYFKLRGRNRKYIVKEAFQSLFLPECLNRRERGYKVPTQLWLRTDLLSHTAFERSLAVASKAQA